MSVIAVDILADSPLWEAAEDWRADVEAAVAMAAAAADAEIADDAELSLLLTDDAAIRVLNHDHRGMDKPTNVLSFPQDDPEADAYGPLLGDIVVAHETVAREAVEEGISFRDHFLHMIVHGFLHLVGYDHMNDDEAEEMEGLETAILARLGIANPYADAPMGGAGR
ncbi:rRNA maturation RNase YbeY [Pleomorphomonas sp. NRK KF1]|uniref:rRNA maturation RNase YbeY n=1 Tax=Pleomorphomonas sp. NRK KF1 TaxID=2943000 RepID=UPI00204470EC|nr:rRNA maturation RNase YbeY [Pleomorphomonas sp. NRK KF1]MCM5553573.1 rRNA maturation RNase YbeY [Pleomorphomonas sp. NRK KF1]